MENLSPAPDFRAAREAKALPVTEMSEFAVVAGLDAARRLSSRSLLGRDLMTAEGNAIRTVTCPSRARSRPPYRR